MIGLSKRKIVFGMQSQKPLSMFPAGKYRIKMRAGKFATVDVWTELGIKRFFIEEENGCWVPYVCDGINIRGEIK